MAYSKKLILHAPLWDSDVLIEFVEACLRDKVVLVCVVGDDCQRVEDVIDELVVADASDPDRFLTTTAHPHEPLDDVRAFAEAWSVDGDADAHVQEVRLTSH